MANKPTKCGRECEVYSRVVGFFRPVKQWNPGKLQEYKDRKEYVIAKTKLLIKKKQGVCGIKEYVKLSLIDYPNNVCSVLFLHGCNMNCSWCHNKKLLGKNTSLPDISFDDILRDLSKNKKMLDGVTITGGEPTINKQLFTIIGKIKETGLKVKVDTNGMRPDVIKKLVESGKVDYIAMDIKTSPEQYCSLGAAKDAARRIKKSAKYLKTQTKIDYEFRTTFIPEIVNSNTFLEMKKLIDGAKNYYLQAPLKADKKKMGEFANRVVAECQVDNFGMRNFK